MKYNIQWNLGISKSQSTKKKNTETSGYGGNLQQNKMIEPEKKIGIQKLRDTRFHCSIICGIIIIIIV